MEVNINSLGKRLCSLFAGIGGFDLAAHWLGWTTAVFVEWEDFPRQVLMKNFKCVPVEQLSATQLAAIIDAWRAWKPGLPLPISVLYGDICHFDATAWRGAIDLVCGGFPCQPFSSAGAGLGAADKRHLWPQMCRVIRQIRPVHVVGENVRGLLTKHPLQFEAVCADLEAEGYDVQPLLFPAAGVGAPHERYRFWFVAHAHHGQRQRPERQICPGRDAAGLCGEADADADGAGRQEPHSPGFAAKPGECGGRTDACTTSDATSLGRHARQSRELHQRAGQGAASQRDGERAGLWTATDRCSTVSADPTGQQGGRIQQPGIQANPLPSSTTHAYGYESGPISHLLRGESDASGCIARDAQGVPSNVRTLYARHRRKQEGAARRADCFRSARAFRLTEPALRGADDGLSAELVRAAGNSRQARKLARRIEKLAASDARNSLKAYGNAIVPQVAYQLFMAMEATEGLLHA